MAADAISKADFKGFRACFAEGQMRADPAVIPKALLRWAVRPVEDDDLGKRILEEMAVTNLVLGVNC